MEARSQRLSQGAKCRREKRIWPTQLGVILGFLVIFLACILWGTRGHPSNADNEDLSVVAKDH